MTSAATRKKGRERRNETREAEGENAAGRRRREEEKIDGRTENSTAMVSSVSHQQHIKGGIRRIDRAIGSTITIFLLSRNSDRIRQLEKEEIMV